MKLWAGTLFSGDDKCRPDALQVLVPPALRANMPFQDARETFLFIATLTLVLGMFATSSFEVIDDAYITFRYAHNLACHGQLVFNLGERVEAISNILWALVLTPAAWLGTSLPHSAVVISVMLTAVMFLRLWQLSAILGAPRSVALASIAVVAGNTTVLHAWMSGLEGALYGTLLVEIIFRCAKGALGTAALMAGFLAATRPEGVVVGALMIVVLLMEKRSFRVVKMPSAIWAAAVGSFVVFRLSYFGSAVPNSVVAKIYLYRSGEWSHVLLEGIRYAWGFISMSVPMVALSGAALVLFIMHRRTEKGPPSSVFILCVLVILWSFVAVMARGGDWMPAYRLLSLYGGLYGVLCLHIPRFCLPSGIPSRFVMPVLLALSVGPAAYAVITAPGELYIRGVDERIHTESTAPCYPEFARRLAPLLREDDIVAAEAIGAVSYRLIDTRVHDVLGLGDPYIARSGRPIFQFGKLNLNYTVNIVRPAVMLFHSPTLLWPHPENLTEFYNAYRMDMASSSYVPLMLVRHDCTSRFAPATSTLRRVRLTPDGIVDDMVADPGSISIRDSQPHATTTSLLPDTGDGMPGRWRRITVPPRSAADHEQSRLIDRLEAIGYVAGSRKAPGLSRVTRYDPKRAYNGVNLYTSGHAPVAILLDMDGTAVHRWERSYRSVWPDGEIHEYGIGSEFWRRARVLDNGDLLALFDGLGIIKLDRDSRLLWANPNNAHHDLDIAPNGDIYVLTRELRMAPTIDPDEPLLEDYVAVLDPSGIEKKRISLLQCFQRIQRLVPVLRHNARSTRDILHTNSIELLRSGHLPSIPGVKGGDVLISSALLHTIAILRMDDARIVWWARGAFRVQHDPTALSNGNLLLFDNLGLGEQSRVLEYVPTSMRITWTYRGTPAEPFFSTTCGTNQRLPNGNTLITESDNGRAFEVTADKEIVWEFYNPHRAGNRHELIATLFALRRLPAEFPTAWMAQ